MEDLPPLLPVQPRLPPPKPNAKATGASGRNVLKLLGYAVVGGIIGTLLSVKNVPALASIPGPGWLKLIPFAALPLIWLLTVGAHELGHLVAGRARGGQFMLLTIGPLMWRRTPSGIRFLRNRSHNISGGMVICLPSDPARVTARDTALMFAGGPLASLLLAAACLALAKAIALPSGAGPGRALALHLLAYTGFISFLLFLFNAIPTSQNGLRTDGARFLALIRGGVRAEQEKAVLMVSVSSLMGLRPAGLNPVLVQQVTALRDASLSDLYGHAVLFHHAVDTGNATRAQAILDYVVAHEAKLSTPVREGIRCEYAWLLATRTTDAVAARAWLDSAGKLEWDPATRLRSEAAVLLAEGKPAEAAAKARQALQAHRQRSLSPVENPYTIELIQHVASRATAPA